MLYEWVDSFPQTTAKAMKTLYDEMEARQTTEAKVYKAIQRRS